MIQQETVISIKTNYIKYFPISKKKQKKNMTNGDIIVEPNKAF